ncbi:hypothetical protein SCLCIDRAFT_33871 [Scleroderma citrinum Foug A]|uniref:Uncharacterized protein n=1 Tax=Scleroderma citrinum Foug A TaxID=1036808 RepID=A0A0C3CQR1_9AGAM|nr:hypothetical protein SCLCIDRAFT_33871 [Scleroderma citrinum Foug A]
MVGAVQEEEEEPEHEDAEHDTVMSGGPEDQQGGLSVPEVIPADFMSVDGQAEFEDRGSASHATQSAFPLRKSRTPSTDSRAAFRMSPYPKSPLSLSSSSTTSTPLSGGFPPGIASDSTPYMSLTKGKGKASLTSIQTSLDEHLGSFNDTASDRLYKLGVLKNEHKAMRLQAYMRQKEITHMEVEAESAHHHTMEEKKVEIELVKEQQELLRLKFALAKLQTGQDSVDNGMSLPTAGSSSTF